MTRKPSPKQEVLTLRPDATLSPTRFFSGALGYRISVPEGYLTPAGKEYASPTHAWSAAYSSLPRASLNTSGDKL